MLAKSAWEKTGYDGRGKWRRRAEATNSSEGEFLAYQI